MLGDIGEGNRKRESALAAASDFCPRMSYPRPGSGYRGNYVRPDWRRGVTVKYARRGLR